MSDADTVTELQRIRLERDELVRQRDRLRREALELTEKIFRLNFRETEILAKP